MCDECKKNKVPEPYYEIGQGFVTIVFKKGAYATENCRSNCISELTERQMNTLQFIVNDNSTSAKTIAEALHISQRTVSTDISVLRNKGYIVKTTKDNRSPWKVLKIDRYDS